MLSKELLDALCCPESKADLILDSNRLISTDKQTRRCYKIKNNIPIMLIEESEILELEEWMEVMKKYNVKIEAL